MNFCRAIVLIAVMGMVIDVLGSGFALYEASTATHALGGAVVGKAVDASANFHNPATMGDFTNVVVTAGFVMENPSARAKVDGHESVKMNPGAFFLPHLNAVVPLPYGFAFGFGLLPAYGLGSRYERHWEMEWSSLDTTVQGLEFNPNISYNITEDWSIAAGFRLLYFDFEQHSRPMAASNGMNYGYFDNRLKGDNEMRDWGWQVGTRYKVSDDFALGLVYKSELEVRVLGHSRTRVSAYDFTAAERARASAQAAYASYGPTAAEMAGRTAYSVAQGMIIDQVNSTARKSNGGADCSIDLPQSITAGFNWDVTRTVHLGVMLSWTEWSSVDNLVFELPTGDKDIRMRWNDTWRFSIAPSWDFADDWTLLASYVFDESCTGRQESTMLPPSDRHAFTFGVVWRISSSLELAADYGLLLMSGGTMHTPDPVDGHPHSMSCHRGMSHAAGLSLSYRF